jgi:hypothetical protein
LFRLSEIDDLETLEQALATDDTDLVYFYCHGKRRPFGRKTWKIWKHGLPGGLTNIGKIRAPS